MKSIVERLLYIALVVLLVGNLFTLFFVIKLTQDRAAIGDSIKAGVEEIKQQNAQSTAYLVCVARALGAGPNNSNLDSLCSTK